MDEKLRKKLGGFNDFPPNWKPIPESDFWHRFYMYGPGEASSRQMRKPEKTVIRTIKYMQLQASSPEARRAIRVGTDMIQAQLFMYSDGSGVAMVQNYNHRNHVYGPPYTFQFAACNHTYKELERRNCYIKSQCTKCKHIKELDSSG